MPRILLLVFLNAALLLNFVEFVNSVRTPPASPRLGSPSSSRSGSSPFKRVHDYVREAIAPTDAHMIEEMSIYAVNMCHVIADVRLWEKNPVNDFAIVPPIGLLPSAFPKQQFFEAQRLQTVLNELYYRITQDYEFLNRAYAEMLDKDIWIRQQVEFMNAARKEMRQHKTLLILRADYMTHQPERNGPVGIKQVEVNVGACGAVSLGTLTTRLHAEMMAKVNRFHGMANRPKLMANGQLAPNSGMDSMAEAMFLAWEQFYAEFGDPAARVVMLIDGKNAGLNYLDQLMFIQFGLEQYATTKGRDLNVVAVHVHDMLKRLHVAKEDHHHLILDGKYKVALVHMISGYEAEHWELPLTASLAEPTPLWKLRYDMETSTAIISPTMPAQLAGTKRIQQLLAEEGTLERFFNANDEGEAEKIKQLRKTFVGLWGLENRADKRVEAKIEEVKRNPEGYVLKSQMGKRHFFDKQIKQMLEEMTADESKRDELNTYTLMEKIQPIGVWNYMRRQFPDEEQPTMVKEVDSEDWLFKHFYTKHQQLLAESQESEVKKKAVKFFVAHWDLKKRNKKIEEKIAAAIEKPESFVLIAQKESGNVNYFSGQLKTMLEEMSAGSKRRDELNSYTLVERIEPEYNFMKRAPEIEKALLVEVHPEVGIFGSYLGEPGKVHFNRMDGYLVRSKKTSASQGGIISGNAFFDSLLLFDEKEFMNNNHV